MDRQWWFKRLEWHNLMIDSAQRIFLKSNAFLSSRNYLGTMARFGWDLNIGLLVTGSPLDPDHSHISIIADEICGDENVQTSLLSLRTLQLTSGKLTTTRQFHSSGAKIWGSVHLPSFLRRKFRLLQSWKGSQK